MTCTICRRDLHVRAIAPVGPSALPAQAEAGPENTQVLQLLNVSFLGLNLAYSIQAIEYTHNACYTWQLMRTISPVVYLQNNVHLRHYHGQRMKVSIGWAAL